MSFERAGLAILMMMLLRIRKYCRIILAAAAKALAAASHQVKAAKVLVEGLFRHSRSMAP